MPDWSRFKNVKRRNNIGTKSIFGIYFGRAKRLFMQTIRPFERKGIDICRNFAAIFEIKNLHFENE